MTPTTASVIVATLNEAANIDHVMDIALSDRAVIEVIIADGGSNDMTEEKIRARRETDRRVSLVHNPDRVQSAGLNRAASLATGTLLLRLDAHTSYADDYVTASLAAFRPGVAVGGPMIARGSTKWTMATATAMEDPLAIGPARFHHATTAESVDTVYLGMFERQLFFDVGGYRSFPSGTVEDTDFYRRWRENGGTVTVDPAIRSWYQPRESWRALASQYYRYGRGKAELVWNDKRLPSLRLLAPALLVAGLAGSFVLGVAATWIPFALGAAAWMAVLAAIAVRAKSTRPTTAIVAATMHLAYGTGVWMGMISGPRRVRTLGLNSRPESSENFEGTEWGGE